MLRKILYSLTLLGLSLTACSTKEEFSNDPYKNYDQLWQILDRNYCYFDIKLPQGVSWRDLYHKHAAELRPGMTTDSLFLVMTKLLAELKDGHVNLSTAFDYGRYWKWKTDYPKTFDTELTEAYLGDSYRIAGALQYTTLLHNGHAQDSIGYIRLASFSSGLSSANINAALSRLVKCRALIIDIRNNGGGQVTHSDMLARHFIIERKLIGFISHKTGPGHQDFSQRQPLYLEPLSRGIKWQRPVVLLIDRGVYSAANDFTLRMKGLRFVTIMGTQTGGGAGLPMSSELPNGWGVRFSSSRTYDASGADVEFGIQPDYELTFDLAQANSGYDTMIEGAVSYLKERFERFKRTRRWEK